MEWSNALATGVEEIDEQHKSLFQWFGELESAAADQRMMTAAYSITRLHHYTRTHFSAEESFMERAGYPHLAAHKSEHDAFRKRLTKLQTEAMVRDVSEDAVALLKEWLVQHISVADMDYVPYVSKLADTRSEAGASQS